MRRVQNLRRVKRHKHYTFKQLAHLLGVHIRTIYNWVRDDGLPALTHKKPHLIVGGDLIDWAAQRKARSTVRLNLSEFRCFGCKATRTPFGRLADLILDGGPTGNLLGICPDCGTQMFKRVSLRRLDEVRKVLDLFEKQASTTLEGGT